MSGITGVGGNNTDLYYLLQQAINKQSKSDGDSDDSNTLQPVASPTTDTTSNSDAQSSNILQDKLKSAILSAIQDAEKSGNTSDLLTVIMSAVDKTLKGAGIDPTSLLGNQNNIDPATRDLLSLLGYQNGNNTNTNPATMDLFSMLGDQTSTNSSNNDLLSLLGNQNANSQQNQNLLGYLLDAKQ